MYVLAEPQCLTQLSIAALQERPAIGGTSEGQIAKEQSAYSSLRSRCVNLGRMEDSGSYGRE